MRANEFVKKFGWDEAIRVVSQAPKSDCAYSLDLEVYLDRYAFSKYEVYIDDLKRIVESYDLVQSIGGLDRAKLYLRVCLNSKVDMVKTKGCIMVHKSMLKQAIADMESCL